MESISLKGKVSVITGASSGIGEGTAEQFAKLGSKLALLARNEANLEATKVKCLSYGLLKDEDVLCIKTDLTIHSDIDAAVEKILHHFKTVHILVNNAGIFQNDTIEAVDMDKYDRLMQLNVRSVIYLTKLLTPHLMNTKGSIVNVSSAAGLLSMKSLLTYSMSKSTLDQFTHCTALDLAAKGVRVNSVNPGVVDTGLQMRSGYSSDQVSAFLEACKFSHPLGRTGSVEEVTRVIAFLASEAASFMTGVTIPVDGGLHVHTPLYLN